MTTPMPRCSCGCGEPLTDEDVVRDSLRATLVTRLDAMWRSENCLSRRRSSGTKSIDGETEAVRRGLVPAPRKKRVRQ